MRVALFGGTFDPIHLGHLTIATAAANQFELDRVLFAPAGLQPHKRDTPALSWDRRMAMVRLACEADPRFVPSAIDAPRKDGLPNYSVDALTTLTEPVQSGSRLFNLVGADTFQHLAKWREPYEVLKLAEWIVVSRPGVPLRVPEGLTLTDAQLRRIHLLGNIEQDVSSTTLRERLAAGEDCSDFLPAAVSEYIAANKLYVSNEGLR